MNKLSIYESEVLLSDLLKLRNRELGDVKDLRLLYKDVELLRKILIEEGKNKVGNVKFRMNRSGDVERLIVNIILRWRVIKMGI